MQQVFFQDEGEIDKPTGQRQKKARLGRYEGIQKSLAEEKDSCKIWVDIEASSSSLQRFNFVDLFSGAGGITQGLAQAGLNPVASVELIPVASATHKRNLPHCHHFCGDISEFASTAWLAEIGSPEVHLVIGGPPCQGFSVAGKRDPNDPRNALFRQFVRVVNEIKPLYMS